MNVAISEFDDGDIIIDPITRWYRSLILDAGDLALAVGLFIVAIFQ